MALSTFQDLQSPPCWRAQLWCLVTIRVSVQSPPPLIIYVAAPALDTLVYLPRLHPVLLPTHPCHRAKSPVCHCSPPLEPEPWDCRAGSSASSTLPSSGQALVRHLLNECIHNLRREWMNLLYRQLPKFDWEDLSKHRGNNSITFGNLTDMKIGFCKFGS